MGLRGHTARTTQQSLSGERKGRLQRVKSKMTQKTKSLSESHSHGAIEVFREDWRQGASKSDDKTSPRSQFEKDVTIGLYLGWGFLFLVFVLWMVA
jgi:hypothetical protein